MIVFYIISGILIFFLVLPFLITFFAQFFKEKQLPTQPTKAYDFGSIITAYKNAEITKPLIASLLRQNYSNHHIYLVADACDIKDWDLTDPRLTVLCPNPALNLKAKSIIYGIGNFVRNHEYIVVFDGDNLAHPDFLKIINQYANLGYKTIQGQRTAKNLDTRYACMDSLGEFYKNYVERYALYLIGSSSVISGSGMAVESNLYKAYLNSPEIQQGKELWKKMLQEDKILQNNLLDKKEKITYAWNAIVYDEKVTTAAAVSTQRSRWLFSYFQNTKNALRILMKGVFGFNWNQLMFGLVTISPPLFILLLASVLMVGVGFFLSLKISLLFIIALCVFMGNILWTLRLSKVPKQVWQAVWSLPLFIWQQALALLKMGNPNKNFKHSEHNRTVTIDELLK